MRIYLASTSSGLKRDTREQFIARGKPKYILETFFNGEKDCARALKDVGASNFLLDSGAFSYMSGAKCSSKMLEDYAERYGDFINLYGVQYYFELDVDTIFGLPFVETIRERLEQKTQKPCIPVWHKGRGVQYWKDMCRRYQYVAIGGLVFHVKASEWPLIHKMVDYAYLRGVKVHGLGFTKTKDLENWNFYSVDSASWTKAAAMGQQRHDFDGRRIVAHRIDGKGKKINLDQLVLHNGLQWCKYQRYMDGRGE